MKLITLIFTSALVLLSPFISKADKILIDFGLSNEESSTDLSGNHWNNLSDLGSPGLTTIVDSRGNTIAGVSLSITDSFPARSTNTIGSEPIYTPTATGDFWYVLNTGDGTATFVLNGLDSSGATVYDLKFFATTNRTAPQVFNTIYTVSGSSTSIALLEAVGNTDDVASINGVVPAGDGSITVMVDVAESSDAFGAISVFDMTSRAPGDPVTPDPKDTGTSTNAADIGSTPNPSVTPGAENPYGLTAYVLEASDRYTSRVGLGEQLRRAGFHVEPLPLDEPPFSGDRSTDVDLIAIGSFVSESPDYVQYMTDYGDLLDDYIDRAGMLIQFTQNDSVEATLNFLPTTQEASRGDQDFAEVIILSPDHLMLDDIPTTNNGTTLSWLLTEDPEHNHYDDTGWEAFVSFFGFEVILSGDTRARSPILMEGSYGQGRFFLASMALDKILNASTGLDEETTSMKAVSAPFFKNLYKYGKLVRDLEVPAITITPQPGENEVSDGAWSIAILPDTQIYSQNFPGIFSTQTAWIRDNMRKHNIRYVLHLGDIVNTNSKTEWINARNSMRLLDDYIPYAFVGGNHDYGPGGNARTRDTLLNDYFKESDYHIWPTYGGAMTPGMMDNTYHLFNAGGVDWIILALEWGPRDSTIVWANQIMNTYDDRKAILVTHAYMNNNGLRYDHTDTGNPQNFNPHNYNTEGGVNDGEELWQKLVKKHDFLLTVNGHVLGDGTGFRSDANDAGQMVHQMLVNYQMRSLGGEGYLRLLTIEPDGHVEATSHSPIYNSYLTTEEQAFSFKMELGERADTNNNDILDYYDSELDSDLDGLNNYQEFMTLGTNAYLKDSDGDGIEDRDEINAGTNPTRIDRKVVQAVINNPNNFDLYTEFDLGALNPNHLLLRKDANGKLGLELQVEKSEDLNSWNPAGDPVQWSIPVPDGKSFYRIDVGSSEAP